MSTLVIVESPAKAKKIASYLGTGYTVQASLGHVRDLPGSKAEIPERYRTEPWANLGVNPQTFHPIYVVPDSKSRTVANLKALAGKADRVILASDDDREGESISWHLSQLLNLKNPQRMVGPGKGAPARGLHSLDSCGNSPPTAPRPSSASESR